MTKCIMRELEDAARKNRALTDLQKTLHRAKLIHKCSCKHSGGVIDPDDCILDFVGKRNEEKVFVGTNDEELRNQLRNLGTVPIFFFKQGQLIMDTPSD